MARYIICRFLWVEMNVFQWIPPVFSGWSFSSIFQEDDGICAGCCKPWKHMQSLNNPHNPSTLWQRLSLCGAFTVAAPGKGEAGSLAKEKLLGAWGAQGRGIRNDKVRGGGAASTPAKGHFRGEPSQTLCPRRNPMGGLALQDGLRMPRSVCSYSSPEANFRIVQQETRWVGNPAVWTQCDYYSRDLNRKGRKVLQEIQGMCVCFH